MWWWMRRQKILKRISPADDVVAAEDIKTNSPGPPHTPAEVWSPAGGLWEVSDNPKVQNVSDVPRIKTVTQN